MKQLTEPPRRTILVGDVREQLDKLPDNSVDTIVTSPPYFKLRNYGAAGQIGLEDSVSGYVNELRLVARGLKRVLKPTGTFWLNMGDTYARGEADGAPPKSLVLAPERLAQALTEDGWVLRNKVVWSKPNPMPTSVRDRLSTTWEVVYCFARERDYFYDLDAIRVPHRSGKRTSPRKSDKPAWAVPPEWRAPLAGSNNGLDRYKQLGVPGHPLGKNPGDVWVIPTAAYRGAHHAVFPPRLVERPIQVGCPEKTCARCGRPWRRERYHMVNDGAVRGDLTPDCTCAAASRPGIVLDPFLGSGTTAITAERLGRDWVGIELNPKFAAIAKERIATERTNGNNERSAA